MNPLPPVSKEADDPRVFFAAERTLLAWIRTGLAMMGFGFVVARFGLFLRELASVRDNFPQHRLGSSLWVGTTLILLGVLVNAGAAVRFAYLVRQLQSGTPIRFRPISTATLLAILLALLGLCLAAYLMFGLAEPVPADKG